MKVPRHKQLRAEMAAIVADPSRDTYPADR